MPAKKPFLDHRQPLIVSCSIAQKKEIDKKLSHIAPRQRSNYIRKLIFQAIAQQHTNYLKEDSGVYSSKTSFQLSCSPEEYTKIINYCQVFLPPKKRSKWIVNLILST
jgi:hypothetical protein